MNTVDRFFPSSKRCSRCGHLNTKLTLTDRTYICHQCGMVKDRDLNAAENLFRAGLARIYACGPVCVRTRTGRHDGSVSASEAPEATSMEEAGSERRDE